MKAIMKQHVPEKAGIVMISCMLFIALLTFISTSMVAVTVADFRSAGYIRHRQLAFYDAEAGVRHTISEINRLLDDGSLNFNGSHSLDITVTTPSPYQFDPVRKLERVEETSQFYFTVTGHYNRASCVIEVAFQQPSVFSGIGVFGGDAVRLQPQLDIYSYDSRVVTSPVSTDSTGQAMIGSNGPITMQNHVTLDGGFIMGADTLGNSFAAPSGYPSSYVGRIDPDPLGAVGGELADLFTYYATNNNNAAAGIVGNTVNTGPHDSLELTSGVYYLTDFTLGAQSEVHVIATPDNPVVLMLHGSFRMQPHSAVSLSDLRPGSFLLFCDTADEVRIQPHSDFSAFVYAPYAEIRLQPQGEQKGMFWGDSVRFQPQSEVFIDTSILDSFSKNYVELTQWRVIDPL